MTTPAKIAANHRNAQRSTGPKDTTRTRNNARKHGLLSKGLTELDDPVRARDLLARLNVELQPGGTLETFLVERIALGMVRVERAARLEAEYINAHRSEPGSVNLYLSGPAPSLTAETIVELADGFGRYEGAHQSLLMKSLRELRDLQRERKATHRVPPSPPAATATPPPDKPSVASFGDSAPTESAPLTHL